MRAEIQLQRSDHYGDAEFLDQQLRLLDLVPRRTLSFVLLALLGVAAVAGLEVSYRFMLDRYATGGHNVAALDLAAKGSLGCWFTSLLLLASAVSALLVYSVRRYRTDDYQGRYRIWRWAAACWLLMAADEGASLRDGARQLMVWLTGTPLWGDGSFWWAILYAIILCAVGARLVIDMRASPFAIVVLLVAGVCEALAIVWQLGLLLPAAAELHVMLPAGAAMLAALALLMAMLLHARHVLLDAEGLLQRRAKSTAEAAIEDDSGENIAAATLAGGSWRKADPPHAVPQPTFQRAAARASTPAASPIPAVTPAPLSRKLTKGERKALKERLIRERLEREGRG